MFPAARKGDPITHDTVTPSGIIGPPATGPCPGKGVVMIEGLPAAHVSCTVQCTGVTGAGPLHPPAVPPTLAILTGSATVFIHGFPAARWFPSPDLGACGVVLGNPALAPTRTVLIGDQRASSPPYDPSRWNTPPIQGSNNCYSYAADDPDGHPPGKPQPGQRCGCPVRSADCASVDAAARCDGMIPAPNPPVPRPGYFVVALVMDPGVDYHWYREGSDGRWSGKPGNGRATDLDASGKPITNPETADRNGYKVGVPANYTVFCGYYYVPAGGVRTGRP